MIAKSSVAEQNKVALSVNKKLTKARFTIAVAESLTSGHLQTLLSRHSGSSAFLLGGVTAYTLGIKAHLLGVDRHEASLCNCVSPQVALEMARGVRKLFGSDIGIGTTGYAEPSPDNNVKEAYACYAIVWGKEPYECEEGRITIPPYPAADWVKIPRLYVQQEVSLKILYVLEGLLEKNFLR